EELIAKPLPLARTFDDAGDIDQLKHGRNELFWHNQGRNASQAVVGNRHDALVRLDRAERIISRLSRRRAGERIKQGAFADVRQANNSDFHRQFLLRLLEDRARSSRSPSVWRESRESTR